LGKNNVQDGTFTEPVFMTLNGEADFERALSEAINEGLACISAIVAPVLRAYLDDAVTCEIGRMKSRSTIKDAKALEKGLEKMFGFGAKVFERRILEALYTKLSLSLETPRSLSFSEAVKKARDIFESKMSRNKKSKSDRPRSYAKSSGARKG
jgi:hypothetical protein